LAARREIITGNLLVNAAAQQKYAFANNGSQPAEMLSRDVQRVARAG
jgi:hypothetical protein